MGIDTSEMKSFLKDNYCPFSRLSEAALKKTGEVLRFFELRQGEQIVIGGASNLEDYLYLVKGRVEVATDGEITQMYINQMTKRPFIVEVEQGSDVNKKYVNKMTDRPFLFPRLPETLSISAFEDAIVCHVDNEGLDVLLSFDELSSNAAFFEIENAEEILQAIRNTATFRSLPMAALEEAVRRMRQAHVTSGTDVIRQAEKGESFYIILAGQAEVWRQGKYDDEQKRVSTMGPGDAFGEEALVLGGNRNATVRMVSDGTLLTMNQQDFNELISMSMIQSVNAEVAKAMIDSGDQLLDVRYEEEYEERFVPGSILIPLPELRKRYTELDKKKRYLVTCAAGKRAAVAALLLKQRHFEVTTIEGGMRDWPFETQKNMEIELILFDFCPYAQRALITMLYNGNPHTLTVIDPENLPPWFEQVSPLGKVPILRVDSKDTIFESSVINDYLNQISSHRLLPKNPLLKTQCRSWIEFGSACLSNVTSMIKAATAEKFDEARDDFLKNLRILEAQVDKQGPYFNGEQFTLVDSTYAPLFLRMKHLFDTVKFYEPEELPRIKSWSENLLVLDAVKNSVVGDFSEIFRHFVRRKGNGGYIDTLMG